MAFGVMALGWSNFSSDFQNILLNLLTLINSHYFASCPLPFVLRHLVLLLLVWFIYYYASIVEHNEQQPRAYIWHDISVNYAL